MFPANPIDPQRAVHRMKAIESKLKDKGLEKDVTEHGLKVFGLEPWEKC
jgi:hypothetical protein